MGTFLDVTVVATDQETAEVAERAAVERAVELAGRFTIFDPQSELCRWRHGASDEPSTELVSLLGLAASWQRRSAGAFNPLSDVLTHRWLRAERDGKVPNPGELLELAASIAEPRFDVVDGRVLQHGDLRGLDLNALAKGFVVDRALDAARGLPGVTTVVINAGGDLANRGSETCRVLVEDPRSPYDNAPPLATIRVGDAAVATSGRARRWFEVGGRRYSRVLDPRTGTPVDHTLAATVVAPDAATADVLATVCSVATPADSLDWADSTTTAVLIVDRAGACHTNPAWDALAL